ncbi:unnamed protein product [Rangifer tarandus platyrhynchus]|uniref:Uncharacterized protein n=2 Tax=Rangifer tarandus platyrhynchus TaxID=3082113 RepID=A0AC60A3Y1_RANTA|nr:unnamed protein product [Rangifer tarandus platyrhynchus]
MLTGTRVKTLHPEFPVTLGRRHLQPNNGHQYGNLQRSIHSPHYRDPHCGCHFYTVWRKDLERFVARVANVSVVQKWVPGREKLKMAVVSAPHLTQGAPVSLCPFPLDAAF